jgi:hypothetical protein
VSSGPGSSAGAGVTRRGIYIRQPHEAVTSTYTVTVTPKLHEVCVRACVRAWGGGGQLGGCPCCAEDCRVGSQLKRPCCACALCCAVQDAPVSDKLAIEEHLQLSATAPWVAVPGLLLLHHNGRRCVCCWCLLVTQPAPYTLRSPEVTHCCLPAYPQL